MCGEYSDLTSPIILAFGITPTCVGNTLKDPSIGAIPK